MNYILSRFHYPQECNFVESEGWMRGSYNRRLFASYVKDVRRLRKHGFYEVSVCLRGIDPIIVVSFDPRDFTDPLPYITFVGKLSQFLSSECDCLSDDLLRSLLKSLSHRMGVFGEMSVCLDKVINAPYALDKFKNKRSAWQRWLSNIETSCSMLVTATDMIYKCFEDKVNPDSKKKRKKEEEFTRKVEEEKQTQFLKAKTRFIEVFNSPR